MRLRSHLVSVLLGVGVLAAATPAIRGERTATPRLVVVVSVDGLSWDRLVYYRPWYVAGFKRLLDESRVEAESAVPPHQHRDRTGPLVALHRRAAAGDRDRGQSLVREGSRRLDPCLELRRSTRARGRAGIAPIFYRTFEKDGRLYVFAQSAALEQWEASGEMGRGITRLGYGPKGETVVFDSEDAITLFNARNGRRLRGLPAGTDGAGAWSPARSHSRRPLGRGEAGREGGVAVGQGPLRALHGGPQRATRRLLVRPGRGRRPRLLPRPRARS